MLFISGYQDAMVTAHKHYSLGLPPKINGLVNLGRVIREFNATAFSRGLVRGI
jgi:hypothetical protein